jgi:hypothetical protein
MVHRADHRRDGRGGARQQHAGRRRSDQRHVDERHERASDVRAVDRVQTGDEGGQLPSSRAGFDTVRPNPDASTSAITRLSRPDDDDGFGMPAVAQGVEDAADEGPIAGRRSAFGTPIRVEAPAARTMAGVIPADPTRLDKRPNLLTFV